MTYHSIKAVTKTKTPLAGPIGDGTEYEPEYDKPVRDGIPRGGLQNPDPLRGLF